MELTDIVMGLFIFLYGSLHGSGDKEILLFQTKLLTSHVVVVRVEHLTDRSCQVLLLYRFLVLSLVERIQVKVVDRLRIPDTECVYDMVAVTYDRHVIRHGADTLVAL